MKKVDIAIMGSSNLDSHAGDKKLSVKVKEKDGHATIKTIYKSSTSAGE